MIVPRTRSERARYGRHKVIAILATFLLGSIAVEVFLPEGFLRPELRLPSRPPEELFRERASGAVVRLEAVVEEVLADSTAPGIAGTTQRFRVRSRSGHPLTVLHDPAVSGRVSLASRDTVELRGVYGWDLRGGHVLTGSASAGEEPGWIRPSGGSR
jgi:hypothetical protein